MSDSDFRPLYARRIVTGHFRRRPIELYVDEIIARIKEEGEGYVSLVYLDIDGFTPIEEKHGYHVADTLLDEIADHLSELKDTVTTSRYVRDSFVLVYDGITLEEAFLKAEQIRKALSRTTFTVEVEDQTYEIDVTFSAGVATYPGDPEDRHQLISLAERASNKASERGGNQISFGRSENMTPKTSHYSPDQLARLKELSSRLERPESALLREALDDLLRKYDQRDIRRGTV